MIATALKKNISTMLPFPLHIRAQIWKDVRNPLALECCDAETLAYITKADPHFLTDGMICMLPRFLSDISASLKSLTQIWAMFKRLEMNLLISLNGIPVDKEIICPMNNIIDWTRMPKELTFEYYTSLEIQNIGMQIKIEWPKIFLNSIDRPFAKIVFDTCVLSINYPKTRSSHCSFLTVHIATDGKATGRFITLHCTFNYDAINIYTQYFR